MIRLVALLGNIGREYAGNRHNAGWMVAEAWPALAGISWQEKFRGLVASIDVAGEKVCVIKPGTFMNESGASVGPAMKFYKLEIGELLVVHDELELPFGVIGFKQGGGLGGHNGLRSVEAHLGSRDFNRFRIGIGRPEHKDIAGYVLADFKGEERRILEERVLPMASTALSLCLDEGFDAAFKRYGKFDTTRD